MTRWLAAFLLWLLSVPLSLVLGVEPVPEEPLSIGTHSQFVFDRHVIDNYWALKYKNEAVVRRFHAPEKHPANPLIAGDGGFLAVVKEENPTKFRMWYQTWVASGKDGEAGDYAMAYAESDDGLRWERPKLGLFEWQGTKDNNIVWRGKRGRASSPFLLQLPESDRRGHRYVLLYRDRDGMRLIGSQDGIHWDASSDTLIAKLHSDTQNAIVYDPDERQYLLFCRAKHLYRTFRGDIVDTGESRRVARMTSTHLWSPWTSEPQQILVPDELDERDHFNCFYGMPTTLYGQVFWGFLWPFKMNTDVHTELAFSRDGARFDRLPTRPKFIERGPDGAWDDGMVFGCLPWVEVGDEWWIYYAGWDGPHGTSERTPGIGLARMPKERLIGMHGPSRGGVLVTRAIRWPGGDLVVNADASHGRLVVRVTDDRRKPLPGFDYEDCQPLDANGVSLPVRWKEKSLAELQGQVVRFEFQLHDAELFTFRATGLHEER